MSNHATIPRAVQKKEWGAHPLFAKLGTAHMGGPCRVCLEIVARGEPAWSVAWRIGIAHERCGYLRPEEHEVHVVRNENDWWWAWRCPKCHLDAASPHKPREGDPLECRRCRKPKLVVGAIVEATGVGRRAVVGAGIRATFIHNGSRGVVQSLPVAAGLGHVFLVAWEARDERAALVTRARPEEVRVI